jgi:GT2 family glycosyltransferase
MAKLHAVGMLIKDRWDLTDSTLTSLYYSNQSKTNYDVYLIDNGSSNDTRLKLDEYTQSGLVQVKNLIHLPALPISAAWNLFLMLTKDYSYRTKMDNDIILDNTTIPPVTKIPANAALPAGALAGAPKSVSIVRGIGQRAPKTHTANANSEFLQYMEQFGIQYNAGLVALVSRLPNVSFVNMFRTVVERTYNRQPYLESGCIQISQSAFNTIGYLDERLLRNSFRDYSQRAIQEKINIGYLSDYGAVHMGADNQSEFPTYTLEQIEQQKQAMAEHQTKIATTMWLNHEDYIVKECTKYKTINIT